MCLWLFENFQKKKMLTFINVNTHKHVYPVAATLPLTADHNPIGVHLPAGDIYHVHLCDEEAQIW